LNVLNDVRVATFGALGVLSGLAEVGVDPGCDFSATYEPSNSLTLFQWVPVNPLTGMGQGHEQVLEPVLAPVGADVGNVVRLR
jgi:hypothetical protein